MRIVTIIKSDQGLKRENNEDFCLSDKKDNSSVCVLCDGMGGLDKGEVASKMTCEFIMDFYKKHEFFDYKRYFKQLTDEVNQKVCESSYRDIDNIEMGTTMVITVIQGGQLYYAHVGDSRIYLLNDGKLNQLTSDHSYAQELLKHGVISKEEALIHPRRNQLTRAIGINKEVEPEVCENPIQLELGNIVLLCSDGLTDMVEPTRIEQIISQEETLDKISNELIDEANKNGGTDNITVCLTRIE